MSWITDRYESVKKKYNEAASALASSKKKEQEYREQKSQNDKAMSANQKLRKVDKARLDDVEQILKCLEGKAWSAVNIPNTISNANKSANSVENEIDRVIFEDGASRLPSVSSMFYIQTVNQNYNSSESVRLFKQEKVRLENEIDSLDKKINSALQTSVSLGAKIAGCNLEQAAYSSTVAARAAELWVLEKLIW